MRDAAGQEILGLVPHHRREVQGGLQTGVRKVLEVRLGLGRVKMAINLATNQRVAIKIMNQKIEEADCERGYEQQVLQMFLNEVRMSPRGQAPQYSLNHRLQYRGNLSLGPTARSSASSTTS